MTKQFTARLERSGGIGSWTYLTVPLAVEEVFGKRGPVAVRGTIDGQAFRNSLLPRGDGRHFVVVKQEIRTAIGKDAGDSVRVQLELDDELRTVDLPEAFERALQAYEAAQTAFDRLSYSHRKEYVAWIESAKKPETKERRLQQAIQRIVAAKPLGR
jgi:hypothetical protein